MDKKYTEFLEKIKEISHKIEDGRDLIPNTYIDKFIENENNFSKKVYDIVEKKRNLKIGIVGEVKAGKSSFLNAMVFEGDSILPEAATPMTAALTKINYGDTSSANVFFYSDYDWSIIEKLSNRYDQEYKIQYNKQLDEIKEKYKGEFVKSYESKINIDDILDNIPIRYKACKELTTMVKKREIDITEFLGKDVSLPNHSNYSEMMKTLNDYVGANGKYTPLVKYTELTINNPLLKGLEIYDTPGLNDPILSRTETTKKFLLECDLVFLLSYTGQFLTSEDITFLTSSLPSSSINHCAIIGSKFDSGLLDFHEKNSTLRNAIINSKRIYNNHAESMISEAIRSNVSASAQIVLNNLKKSLPPEYSSALMYNAAKKIEKKLEFTNNEEHIIKILEKRFLGFEKNESFLKDLSNIDNIKRKHFDISTKQKETYINDKVSDLLKTQSNSFLSLLNDINTFALENLENLNKYDKIQLENNLTKMKKNLNSIRRDVKNIFEISAVDQKRRINNLTIEIEKFITNHTDIQIITSTSEHRESEGMWWWKKTYNVTTTKHTADVHEAIAQIRSYITESKQHLNSVFDSLIEIEDIKKNIKTTILGAFDLSNEEFDEKEITIPVEIALKEITLPKVTIDNEKYNEIILKSFSSVAEGNEIARLKLELDKVLQVVSKDFCEILNSISNEISIMLNNRASMFIDDVSDKIEKNIGILQKNLENKEESIKKYNIFIDNTSKYKKEISNLQK